MWITLTDRYILRYFFKAFWILGLIFLGVSLSAMYLDQFDHLSHVSFGTGFLILLMQLTQFIQPLLPLLVMVATMMTFWNLVRHSELVAMRATGQSVWRLFRPLFLAAFGLGIFYVFIFNPLSVSLNKKLQDIRFNEGLVSKNPFEFGDGGFWLKEKGDKDILVLFAKEVHQKDDILQFEKLTGFLMSFDHHFLSRLDVEKAVLSPHEFVFSNAQIFTPGDLVVMKQEIKRPTTLSLKKIRETLSDTSLVSFWKLPSLISFLKKTGMSAHKQVAYFYSLLFFPFLLSSFSLMGLAFSISKHIRQTRFFIRVALGMMSGFVFFFIDKITLAMTHAGTLPLFLGITGTSLVVCLLTFSFLIHKEDS